MHMSEGQTSQITRISFCHCGTFKTFFCSICLCKFVSRIWRHKSFQHFFLLYQRRSWTTCDEAQWAVIELNARISWKEMSMNEHSTSKFFKISVRVRRILALSIMVRAHVYPTSRKIIRSCLPRVHFIKFELPEWQTRRRKTKALRCLPPCRISPLLHPKHRFPPSVKKGIKSGNIT